MSKEEKETKEKKMKGESEQTEEGESEEVKEERKEVKKEKKKDEIAGIAHIYASYNNTIVHVTDLAGNTLSRVSGGMVTKHSRLKANPTTAMFVAKRAGERAKDLGITTLYVRLKAKTNAPGMGPGGHEAVKTLGKEGFRIIAITDTTKFPRGGPKKKGGKRGRRV